MTRELPVNITICQSVLQSQNMETALVSFAEMGVTDVIPIYTERVLKPRQPKQEETQQAYTRWVRRFVKNSLRDITPIVHEPMDFTDAVKLIPDCDVAILAYENQHDPMCTAKALAECKNGKNIIVFIGPERGFDPGEVELAKKAGAHIVSLGNRIIRAANAGAILLGMLVYILELHGETKGGENIV